jgi:hypothetical protein
MSRWKTYFESHPFQKTWTNLKVSLVLCVVDDKTIITSVEEVARLKKVVAYIDALLLALDSELTPQTLWDSFSQQATECATQIATYNQNKNIGHIQSANLNADNLLSYVRPYVVAHGKAAKAANEAFKAYAAEIKSTAEGFVKESQEQLAEIEEIKQEITGKAADSEKKVEEIEAAFVEIFGEEEDGKYSEFNKMLEDLESKSKDVISYHDRLFDEDADDGSIAAEITEAHVNSLKQATEIEKTISELKIFHKAVFGVADASGKKSDGLKLEIDVQKLRYDALIKQVQDLLPGATSAALASSYATMKDSFRKPIRNANILFYSSIGLLMIVSLVLLIDTAGGDPWTITTVKSGDWQDVLQGMVFKLPFYGPLIWLAYFASTRRSEFQRLQQEYAHKEALATSFESYKKQVMELGETNNPLLAHLLKKAVDAVAFNASESLDKKHGDKMPIQEAIEKSIEGLSKSKSFLEILRGKML